MDAEERAGRVLLRHDMHGDDAAVSVQVALDALHAGIALVCDVREHDRELDPDRVLHVSALRSIGIGRPCDTPCDIKPHVAPFPSS